MTLFHTHCGSSVSPLKRHTWGFKPGTCPCQKTRSPLCVSTNTTTQLWRWAAPQPSSLCTRTWCRAESELLWLNGAIRPADDASFLLSPLHFSVQNVLLNWTEWQWMCFRRLFERCVFQKKVVDTQLKEWGQNCKGNGGGLTLHSPSRFCLFLYQLRFFPSLNLLCSINQIVAVRIARWQKKLYFNTMLGYFLAEIAPFLHRNKELFTA